MLLGSMLAVSFSHCCVHFVDEGWTFFGGDSTGVIEDHMETITVRWA